MKEFDHSTMAILRSETSHLKLDIAVLPVQTPSALVRQVLSTCMNCTYMCLTYVALFSIQTVVLSSVSADDDWRLDS